MPKDACEVPLRWLMYGSVQLSLEYNSAYWFCIWYRYDVNRNVVVYD